MNITDKQKIAIREHLQKMVNDFDSDKRNIDKELRNYSVKIDKLPDYVESIDDEFEKLTGITQKDISFLVFASILQMTRQLITANLKSRLTDKESAQKTPFHSEEHSDRRTRQYYATKTEIANNPVPFDAVRKSETVKNNGNPKLNGFNHRYTAIGHDPLLGLIFGTANIMTKTISIAKGVFMFETYHVGSVITSNGNGEYNVDMLTNQASTTLMFEHIYTRLKTEGKEGWEALVMSLGKELVHLLSDIRTSKSLPLPLVSSVSPDISRVLNLCGIDALSATTLSFDLFVSKMIDTTIAYMHAWCFNSDTDGPIKTYEVRTQKIIYFSNLISLSSTTVQTLFRAYMGDVSAMSKFDFGGAISSLGIVWKTPLVISDIKSEYIRSKTVNYLNEQ